MSRKLETVLIVDDSAPIRRFVAVSLTGLANTVLEAESGTEALACARDSRPDLILLDLSLPDMTGVDVLRALRSDPDTRATPVIVITALGAAELAAQSHELGAAALVTKPFRPSRLRDLIVRVVGEEPAV